MKKNNFSLKKSNIIFAILASIGLHYLLNPSESVSSPLIAILVRLVSASLMLSLIFLIARPKQKSTGLAYVFAFICIWFTLGNFPENTLALFLLFLFLGFGFLISAYLISESGVGMVSRGLDFLLFFWVLSLSVQVLIYFLTSEVVDFHKWLHPLSEARIGGAGLFVRFTGVLIEPGTYANWVYGVVLLRGLSGSKLFDRLNLVSVLSILITLSAWGVIAVGAYLIAYFGKNMTFQNTKVYRRAMGAAAVLLIVGIIIYSQFSVELGEAFKYLSDRSELADGSGIAKVQAYQGFSNIFIRIFLVGLPVNYDFCSGCLSSQDAGIFVNLAVRAGMVFTGAVFFIIVKCVFRRYGAIACACLIPLAFAKYFYFEPLFWALFGCCFLDLLRGSKILDKNSSHMRNVFPVLKRQSLFRAPTTTATVPSSTCSLIGQHPE